MLYNVLSQESFWIVNKTIACKYGIVQALFLSVLYDKFLYYRKNNMLYKEEWFYCTREQVENDLALSSHEQRISEENLCKVGFIEIKKMGLPAKNYYRIDEKKITEFLGISN